MTPTERKDRQGKLKRREDRKKRNKDLKRKNNQDLYAGSPMFYYCRDCGEEISLPETHPGPSPKYCRQCEDLNRVS